MAVTLVKTLFTQTPKENVKNVTVSGWVRTMRESKAFAFVELNDGSYFRNLQVVLEADKLPNYRELTQADHAWARRWNSPARWCSRPT